MPHDLTYIELTHALAQAGCALCRLGERYRHTYLRWLLRERVNDLTTRSTLAQSWGFCVAHAWLLQEMEWEQDKDGIGTAILWEWLIERYRIRLQQSLAHSDALQQRFLRRWRRRQQSRLWPWSSTHRRQQSSMPAEAYGPGHQRQQSPMALVINASRSRELAHPTPAVE